MAEDIARITALERRVAALEIDRARREVATRLASTATRINWVKPDTPPLKGWRGWLKFRFW